MHAAVPSAVGREQAGAAPSGSGSLVVCAFESETLILPTLARALIQRLARVQGAPVEEVPSPTFTLVQIYELPALTVWHFDLYRIRTPDEAWELGIEDAFQSGVSLIEWPERVEAFLPSDTLRVELDQRAEAEGRRVCLRGGGAWAGRLADAWPRIKADVG
jgi:tRNA threonylcarbamoyladenosine biosynthesis protein TsaE